MELVFGKLSDLDIEPLGPVVDEVGPSAGIERLRRRAEVIRREWASEVEDEEVKAPQQDAGVALGGNAGYVADLWADGTGLSGALAEKRES